MTFVLDASVCLAWCFEDESSSYADGILERLRSGEAFVAPIWGFEIANGLVVAERRGRIGPGDAGGLIEAILSLPIAVDPMSRRQSMAGTHRLARKHGLSAYDAAYLEVATRQGLPLATLDARLAHAAEEEGPGALGL